MYHGTKIPRYQGTYVPGYHTPSGVGFSALCVCKTLVFLLMRFCTTIAVLFKL